MTSSSKSPNDDPQTEQETAAEEDLDEGSREHIAEFLAQFPAGAHSFMINRLEPREIVVRGQVRHVAGHLATLHRQPTLDELRERWGGGVFEIRVTVRSPKGNRIVACRKVEISGDPRVLDDTPPPAPAAPTTAPPAQPESPNLVQKILEHAFDDKKRSEERYERERRELLEKSAQPPPPPPPAGPGPDLLRATLEAIERNQREQLKDLRAELDRRDREMAELRTQVHASHNRGSVFENPEFLKILLGRGADEAKGTADQYRHELQLERDRHQREVQAERERRERELEAERRDRDQQVAVIERLHQSEIQNLKALHAQLVASKDDTITRLTDEARGLRNDARPRDTLTDLDRMGKVLSAVRDFVPSLGGEPAEAAPGWERLLERAQPLLEKVVENVSKPPTAVNVYPQGTLSPEVLARLPAMLRARQAAAASGRGAAATPSTDAATAATPFTGAPAAPTVGSVSDGLSYLEASFQSGRPVAEAATQAITSFPKSDLRALIQAGPEFLLAEIEKRAPESTLVSRGGQRYVRELVDALKAEVGDDG